MEKDGIKRQLKRFKDNPQKLSTGVDNAVDNFTGRRANAGS